MSILSSDISAGFGASTVAMIDRGMARGMVRGIIVRLTIRKSDGQDEARQKVQHVARSPWTLALSPSRNSDKSKFKMPFMLCFGG